MVKPSKNGDTSIMKRLFLFAFPLLAVGFALCPAPSDSRPSPNGGEVGPTVLMNARRAGNVQIVDLRDSGRAVPDAKSAQKAEKLTGAPLFLLGETTKCRDWAEKHSAKNYFVVMPHLMEVGALPDVPQLKPRVAQEKVKSGWPIFDVSEAPEWRDLRLPNSQRLDFNQFRAGNHEFAPKNRPFIVACRVGHRSQLVVQQLRREGFDARNLEGGLWQWEVEGLPMEGETAR